MKKSLWIYAAAALGLICGVYFLGLNSPSAAFYATYIGAVCYLLFGTVLAGIAVARARLGWRGGMPRFVAIVGVQTAAAALLCILANECRGFASAVRWDPQGELSDSDMFASPCDISDLESVSNAKGDTANARYGSCGWGPWAGMGYGYIVVAVTRSRGTEESRDVVFRYEPTSPKRWAWPTMIWLSDDILSITVGKNAIEQVSKQRLVLDGLNVRYSLGPAKKPPMTIWDRY